MHIDRTSNDKRSNNHSVMVVVFAIILVLAPAAVTLLYYSPSSAAAQSSSSSNNQGKLPSANTTGVGKIGNENQLGKVAGNNSQIMANNTKIGTGKTFQAFGKEHKVTAPTPNSIKALPLQPQLVKANNMSSSAAAGSAGGAGNKTGTNMTNATSSSTAKNMTGAAMGGIKSQHHLGGGKPAG